MGSRSCVQAVSTSGPCAAHEGCACQNPQRMQTLSNFVPFYSPVN